MAASSDAEASKALSCHKPRLINIALLTQPGRGFPDFARLLWARNAGAFTAPNGCLNGQAARIRDDDRRFDPPRFRDAFLRSLVDKLGGRDVGAGELHRMAIAARQLVMWRSRPMMRVAEQPTAAILCRRSPLFTDKSRVRHQDALASRPAGGELTLGPPMRSPIHDGMLPIVVTTR